MDLQVCNFAGAVGKHLCYNDAIPIQQGGHSSGAIRVFDNTYTQLDTDFGSAGSLIAPDIHELNTPSDQGSQYLIQDVYQTISANLSRYGGPEDGHILNGCFQVLNSQNRSIEFQWCSLDHVPLDDTYVYLRKFGNVSNTIAGKGGPRAPWDYFHLNSIDRNSEGDYIVSGRHTNAIYKVAGTRNPHGAPGSLLWILGGKRNQFHSLDVDFSRQHTVRFHDADQTTTTISLFDNGSDGTTSTTNTSSGKLVSVNNYTMTATLRLRLNPPKRILSASQGSMQALPNGNWLVGWGAQPYYTEYSSNGTVLYHAQFGRSALATKGLAIQSYRAWKFPWVGRPAAPPDVVAYAHNCSGALYAYASWNGATEVVGWRFYTSDDAVGPWKRARPVASGGGVHVSDLWPRTGFETTALLRGAGARIPRFAYAEAVGAGGQALGRTLPAMAFVPSGALAQVCGEASCPARTTAYRSADSLAWQCQSRSLELYGMHS